MSHPRDRAKSAPPSPRPPERALESSELDLAATLGEADTEQRPDSSLTRPTELRWIAAGATALALALSAGLTLRAGGRSPEPAPARLAAHASDPPVTMATADEDAAPEAPSAPTAAPSPAPGATSSPILAAARPVDAQPARTGELRPRSLPADPPPRDANTRSPRSPGPAVTALSNDEPREASVGDRGDARRDLGALPPPPPISSEDAGDAGDDAHEGGGAATAPSSPDLPAEPERGTSPAADTAGPDDLSLTASPRARVEDGDAVAVDIEA